MFHVSDGTTDCTRTIHFGRPSQKEREFYTRVLLGNLSLERLVMCAEKRPTGSHIDSVARQFLWQVGEDFGHGTGHGVGHFLNVHEGPHSISPASKVTLKHGMIVTNEPGFYLKNEFGIRVENILLVLENRGKLSFENVTRVNYEPNLIEKKLLSRDMREYINHYHHTLREHLLKSLSEFKDDLAVDYLERKTKMI